MNDYHAICATPEWADYLRNDVLIPLAGPVELGRELLELGPGPGAATDWLRTQVERVVSVELEAEAADRLRQRFAGTNVEVRQGDGAHLPDADGSYDSVATFTMLHHVPTVTQQNAILAEALRVLRPGGVLVGSDGIASAAGHESHAGDTYNPVEPGTLITRLQTIGFAEVMVAVSWDVRFVARKAATDDEGGPK